MRVLLILIFLLTWSWSLCRAQIVVPEESYQFNIDLHAIHIPQLNVQEIDSVIQMNSGQPIVMGGLLQDRVATNENGVRQQHPDLWSQVEILRLRKISF